MIFSALKKGLRGSDETTLWAGFGPRAVVWRPWSTIFIWGYTTITANKDKLYLYHARVIRQEFLQWSWNEVCITIKWDTASWWDRNSCKKRCSLFLLPRSDYQRLDISLHFIITNFHTEIIPQVKVSCDIIPWHLHNTRLVNHAQLVKHSTLNRFD